MAQAVVEELLELKHRVALARAKALDAADLAFLAAIVSGQREHPRRERACALLVAANASLAVSVLGPLLRRDAEPMTLRAAAAAALGRTSDPAAELALVEGVSAAAEVTLRARIASSLCKVGTERSLRALQTLADDREESVRTLARFGLTLFAHRAGRGGLEVPRDGGITRPPPDGATTSFMLTRPPEALLREVLPALSDDAYGVRLGERSTFAIDCDEYWLLCLDAELFEAGLHQHLVRSPSLIGFLAHRSQVDGSFSTSRVILGGPSTGSSFYLAAFRTDGRQSHTGSGAVEKDQAPFEFLSTEAERLVVSLRGVLTKGSLKLDTALYSRKGLHVRTPGPRKWVPGRHGETEP